MQNMYALARIYNYTNQSFFFKRDEPNVDTSLAKSYQIYTAV